MTLNNLKVSNPEFWAELTGEAFESTQAAKVAASGRAVAEDRVSAEDDGRAPIDDSDIPLRNVRDVVFNEVGSYVPDGLVLGDHGGLISAAAAESLDEGGAAAFSLVDDDDEGVRRSSRTRRPSTRYDSESYLRHFDGDTSDVEMEDL